MNQAPKTPATMLRDLAYAGALAEVLHLLKEGVDPNVADEFGRTALSHACLNGHEKIVDALLSAGAWVDPHEDYDTKETPLMNAASNGHLSIVRKLIAAGAAHQNHNGVGQRTAEAYARVNGHLDVADFLATLQS